MRRSPRSADPCWDRCPGLLLGGLLFGAFAGPAAAAPVADDGPTPNDEPVRVALIGDSITFGAGVPAKQNYPTRLQTLLGPGFDVQNAGVNGATLLSPQSMRADGKWYQGLPAYQKAQAFRPQVVVVMLGTNDSKMGDQFSAAAFEKEYAAFVDALQALPSRPQVFLCTPPPVERDVWKINDAVVTGTIVPAVKRVAALKKTPLIDVHAAFGAPPDGESPKLFSDGVHPNPAGATLIARTVHAALVPLGDAGAGHAIPARTAPDTSR